MFYFSALIWKTYFPYQACIWPRIICIHGKLSGFWPSAILTVQACFQYCIEGIKKITLNNLIERGRTWKENKSDKLLRLWNNKVFCMCILFLYFNSFTESKTSCLDKTCYFLFKLKSLWFGLQKSYFRRTMPWLWNKFYRFLQ